MLDPAQREALNSIALEARQSFNALVSRLSLPHGDSIDWWVTPVASRNVFSCALFLRCCQLLLAVRAVESGTVDEIVVESPGLAAVLRETLADLHPRVSVRTRQSAVLWRAGMLAGMCYRMAAAGFHALGQIICSRLFRNASRPVPPAPCVLVDTFIYRDSFRHGYRDRHYPGLLECLTEEQRRQVCFLPTYYKIKNYAWLFRALRNSNVNFLLKEDWLRLGDYLYALTHPYRLLRFTVGKCDFEGMNVAPMVNEALYQSFAASGSIEGLLRYRLALRLGESRVPVSKVIDWFENQEIDHGSNAGFRRYLPQARVTGYQGFVFSPHYLCMFPTHDEMRFELIPHRVAVMGPALVQPAREFCPELEVCVAPALRYSGLWRESRPRTGREEFRILVALPLMADECDAVLELVAAAVADFPRDEGGRWRLRVKRHPAMDAGGGKTESLIAQFERADGDFDELLAESDVLVSGASSVCVQAVAHGIPVAVLGNPRGITFNPIPEGIDRELWTLCHTPGQLAAALRGYVRRDEGTIARHQALGRTVRERYFAPVTREAVVSLLLPGSAAGA